MEQIEGYVMNSFQILTYLNISQSLRSKTMFLLISLPAKFQTRFFSLLCSGNEEENPRVTTSRQQPLKTNYVCVAGSPDVHALGKQDAGVAAKITPVEASCNDLPCPRYREGRELQCVVCVR